MARFQCVASFSSKTFVKYDVFDAPKPQSIVFYDVFATPMSAIFRKSVQNHRKTHAFRPPSRTCESIEREARLNGNCWIRNLHCLSLSVSFNTFMLLSVSVLMILSLPASVSPLLCLSSFCVCLPLPAFVGLRLSLFVSVCL